MSARFRPTHLELASKLRKAAHQWKGGLLPLPEISIN
jgi:hypothetical protein